MIIHASLCKVHAYSKTFMNVMNFMNIHERNVHQWSWTFIVNHYAQGCKQSHLTNVILQQCSLQIKTNNIGNLFLQTIFSQLWIDFTATIFSDVKSDFPLVILQVGQRFGWTIRLYIYNNIGASSQYTFVNVKISPFQSKQSPNHWPIKRLSGHWQNR